MTYDERVRAYEAEGMTRSDAQGIVDLEDLQQQDNPTMSYNAKAGIILDTMLSARKRRGDTMTHTPGPWVAKSGHNQTILGPNGEALAFTSFGKNIDDKANAAFIVRACNAHEDLLAAARNLLNASRLVGVLGVTEVSIAEEGLEKIIAKAEGRA